MLNGRAAHADRASIAFVGSDVIDEVWQGCLPLLMRLRDRDENRRTPEEWRELIECGQRQLWVAITGGRIVALALTSIELGRNLRRLVIRGVAGEDMESWLGPGLHAIEAWARAEGCNDVEINGRPGWRRALWRLGYRPAFVISRKEL